MKVSDTWIIHVYTSDPPYDNSESGANLWRRHVTLGQETLVTNVYCHMDALQAFLIVENCTRLTLVGESMPGNAGECWCNAVGWEDGYVSARICESAGWAEHF